MKKILEDYLWNEISIHDLTKNPWLIMKRRIPREVINEMLQRGWIQNEKQAWRTLEKWLSKNKYNYGGSLDLGWGEIHRHPSTPSPAG